MRTNSHVKPFRLSSFMPPWNNQILLNKTKQIKKIKRRAMKYINAYIRVLLMNQRNWQLHKSLTTCHRRFMTWYRESKTQRSLTASNNSMLFRKILSNWSMKRLTKVTFKIQKKRHCQKKSLMPKLHGFLQFQTVTWHLPLP